MNKSRRKKMVQRVGQCRDCTVKYCPEAAYEECCRRVFIATAEGTVYECPERGKPYWELMCA